MAFRAAVVKIKNSHITELLRSEFLFFVHLFLGYVGTLRL